MYPYFHSEGTSSKRVVTQSTQLPSCFSTSTTIQLRKEPVYENGNQLVVSSPPVTRSPSPLSAKSSITTFKSNPQSTKSSNSTLVSLSNQVPASSSSSAISKPLQQKSSSSLAYKNDTNSKYFASFDCQNNSNVGTAQIDISSTNDTSNTNTILIPKLTIDVTSSSATTKQKPTTLGNETSQTNLIILNTPPSPAATPSDDKGVPNGQRNSSPQNQQESVINNAQVSTLTPTYLSGTSSSSMKPSPATSPLAALKRHPGTKTPTSDPVSPNIPTHPELDRRHSDSTNWPSLTVSPKVFTSVSTSSAASSITSASTTEASDSQDSPLLHRPKLSQNGRELTVEKNNHTYQNTNLIGPGKFSAKI